MAKVLEVHAGERIDLEDFEQATFTFPKDEMNLNQTKSLQDRWSRVISGFRVEVPDQALYPGRIVIHNGYALTRTGQRCYNEDFPTTSRMVTLDGASITSFYVEVTYVVVDADSDARAFWDPTVINPLQIPSGDPSPDGQEYGDTVATRKIMDWAVVTPISTTAFTRTATPTTQHVPLAIIDTDPTGAVTGVTTEKPSTTLLEDYVGGTSVLKVQDPQHFTTGTITIGLGLPASVEVAQAIVTTDQDSKIITLGGALLNAHLAGEIVIRDDIASPDLIEQSTVGYYSALALVAPQDDSRDRMFQGDEIHGRTLSRGFSTPIERSDLNLQSLKDHIDFLSSQLEELKWGNTSPYVTGVDSDRTPPGMGVLPGLGTIPAIPRYFDRSAGVNSARTASVTVGDGVRSWGDFVGATQAAINAALGALPASGGVVYIKSGDYALAADVDITANCTVVADQGAIFTCNGGRFHIDTTDSITLKGLNIVGGTSNVGIYFSTANPTEFTMEDCYLLDAQFVIHDTVLPPTTRIEGCKFRSVVGAMIALSLVDVTNAAGVLAGTWSECTFENTVAAAIQGACVSLFTAGQMSIATFINCSFSMTLVNSELIYAGANADSVHFTNCRYTAAAVGAGARNYVTLPTGSSNIWFTNCNGTDVRSTFVHATLATNLHIEGYLNTAALGSDVSHITLVNCNKVWIKGCQFRRASTAPSYVSTNIYIGRTAAATLSDFFIESNTFECTADNGSGIIFDHTAGGANTIKTAHIKNNTFSKCETGICFLDAIATPDLYYDFSITGNMFEDITSSFQKMGIFLAGSAQIQGFNVSNNTFLKLNPPNVALGTRAAVYTASTHVSHCIFANNTCSIIGDAANATAITAGFYLGALTHGSISGNRITYLNGTVPYGIYIVAASSYSEISNNTIFELFCDTNAVQTCGIVADDFLYTTIAGNVLSTIENINAGGTAAAIGTTHAVATSSWDHVTIIGNSYHGVNAVSAKTHFISISSLAVEGVTISGNSVDGINYRFLDIASGAGGNITNITVTGNTMKGSMGNASMYINANAGTITDIIISGNVSKDNTAVYVGALFMAGPLVISNNVFIDKIAASRLIYLVNCEYASITDNVCKTLDALAKEPIYLAAGCDFYTIKGNTVEHVTGANAINSIDTSTTAGGGYVAYNLVDALVNLNAGVDNTNVAPPGALAFAEDMNF